MLGGLLTTIDWRLVFLINVPLAVLAVVLTLRATPQLSAPTPPAGSTGRARSPSGCGIAALVVGLSHGQDPGWGDPLTVAALVGSVLLLAAFVVIELRVKSRCSSSASSAT